LHFKLNPPFDIFHYFSFVIWLGGLGSSVFEGPSDHN
jgi:hypothetical protein